MAMRIRFTADDLARTRIAVTMGPFAETIWALSMLRCPRPVPAVLSGWKDQVRGRRTGSMGELEALVPPGDLGVDLFSHAAESVTIEKGIEGLLALPHELMLAEMGDLARRRKVPASAWAAAEAGSEARLRLAEAIRACYAALLEPYWPAMHAHLQAERTARGRIMVDGGIDMLLSTLDPQRIHWRPPVLEVDCLGQADVSLGGQGLTVVPSMFIGTSPVLMVDQPGTAGQRVRLAFSTLPGASARVRSWDGGRLPGKGLSAVIGRTRTVVLSSIETGCTTSELARRVGVSVAAASQHATALRGAGLIATRRNGAAVFHTLTQLGAELLAENGVASPTACRTGATGS
jgi:DNA-binding transcriptional ArsR family regulator